MQNDATLRVKTAAEIEVLIARAQRVCEVSTSLQDRADVLSLRVTRMLVDQRDLVNRARRLARDVDRGRSAAD
jgi:hypothetical protein